MVTVVFLSRCLQVNPNYSAKIIQYNIILTQINESENNFTVAQRPRQKRWENNVQRFFQNSPQRPRQNFMETSPQILLKHHFFAIHITLIHITDAWKYEIYFSCRAGYPTRSLRSLVRYPVHHSK